MWTALARLLAWSPLANAIARWALRRPADVGVWDGGVLAREVRHVLTWDRLKVDIEVLRSGCARHAPRREHVLTLIGAVQLRDGLTLRAAHAGGHRVVRQHAWEAVTAVSPVGAVEIVVSAG
jgi:hypothetical protein